MNNINYRDTLSVRYMDNLVVKKNGHEKYELQGHTECKKYGRFSGKNKIWTCKV